MRQASPTYSLLHRWKISTSYHGENYKIPPPLDRDATVIGIHEAKFKHAIKGGQPLTEAEIAATDVGAAQEPGTRPSCPLPYECEANGLIETSQLRLSLEARNRRFDPAAIGVPFNVYVYGAEMTTRAYAVKAGDKVEDSLEHPPDYLVRVDGPNGFGREKSAPTPTSIRSGNPSRPADPRCG